MTNTNFSISAYQAGQNLFQQPGEVRHNRVERRDTQIIGDIEEITRTVEEFEDAPSGRSHRVLEVSTERIPLEFNHRGVRLSFRLRR